jgi:hypothetical protein
MRPLDLRLGAGDRRRGVRGANAGRWGSLRQNRHSRLDKARRLQLRAGASVPFHVQPWISAEKCGVCDGLPGGLLQAGMGAAFGR